jgi:hypothetical protein
MTVGLAACLVWNVLCFSMPRLSQARGLYDISRADVDRVAAARVHEALVFVHSDYWTEYANLSWLNGADLGRSDIVFAKDLGTDTNRSVAKSFPGRDVFCYDRDRTVALESCSSFSQGEEGRKP